MTGELSGLAQNVDLNWLSILAKVALEVVSLHGPDYLLLIARIENLNSLLT